MKSILPLVLFSILTLNVFAQRMTISGYITDKESGERLIGASVYDKNTLQGTTANNFGFYSISLPVGKVSLIVSFIGYSPQLFELNLTSDITLNIPLILTINELGEITVVGNKVNKVEETQMSSIDIPIQKLQRIPVIMGEADVLKVIQLLPGVQSGTEGTSGIYVRGGGPDQNLFLLDGVPVYNASHLLGFFSVFNPDAVKTIKLYKGGFPARFGGRLSSVVDISMKDGNMKKIRGDFSIGIISSKLSLEGPIVKDKTSFMLSMRRTYLEVLTIPLFWYINSQTNNENTSGGVYFHDLNLKLNHIFNERSRLYLSGYLGKDKGYGNTSNEYSYTGFENKPVSQKSENDFGLGWGNNIASIRWNYLLNNRLFSNTTLTYSRYRFEVESDYTTEDLIAKTSAEDYFRYFSGIEDWAAKIDFDYFPSPRHDIKFGGSFSNHHFSPGVSRVKFDSGLTDPEAGTDTTFGNQDIYANELSFFAEDDITLTDKLKINAGLHLSVFMVDEKTFVNLQPRLSLRFKASDNLSLKASYSRMAQHVHLLTTSGINLPTDLWLPVTKNFDPPISDQVALGMALNLPKGLEFTMEGFYKTMNNLIEYKEGASFMGSAMNWENKVEKGKGWSYGLEVMLEKTIGKTTGWIAYTWSKTERQFANLNFGNVFPAKYDRRHDISIVVTHEFNKRIDISGTWVYGTGNAVTLAIMDFPQANIPNTGNNYFDNSNLPDYGGRNNYRMPAYHRLDIGVNFHKEKKHGIRTWSFSVYNAYNRQNPFMLMWGSKGGDYVFDPVTGISTQTTPRQTVLKQFSLFPLIPSISYSFKF
jgi:outer membrane receptor for ferrienterochelin and colicin